MSKMTSQKQFTKRLMSLLKVCTQLSRDDIDPATAGTMLLCATKMFSSVSVGLDDVWHDKKWREFVGLHLMELVGFSGTPTADQVFSDMWRDSEPEWPESGRVHWLRAEKKYSLAVKLGDLRSACLLAQFYPCKVSSRVVSMSIGDQTDAHRNSLNEWTRLVQEPTRRLFYARFSDAASATDDELSMTFGKTITRLLDAWREKLSCSNFWKTQTPDCTTRTRAMDGAVDKKLIMLIKTAKFMTQTMLFRHTHNKPPVSACSGVSVVCSLIDLATTCMLAWTVASYERLYRVLVLQIQARSSTTPTSALERLDHAIQKLSNLAREHTAESGAVHWGHFCSGSFFDDFLIAFNSTLAISNLSARESRVLECMAQTTDRSLRVIMRMFVQMVVVFISPTTRQCADALIYDGFEAQSRACSHLESQTDVVAKMTQLIACT